jgi:hypothetical protein
MGAKTRVIPGFLGRVLEEEAPRGTGVADLMTGTGVVAAFAARRNRVFASDAAAYSYAIARAFIEHDPGTKEAFLGSVDPERDLGAARRRNAEALDALYAPALEREAELLGRFERGESSERWSREYRRFLEEPGAVHGDSRGGGVGLYAGAAPLLEKDAIARRRERPGELPACLVTAYHANIYFGLRQAIDIDSLRAAIDAIDPGAPHAARKKVHYLSALLHAASVSTSGTSHFAQPRHLTKASELRAMARRRLARIPDVFAEFSREILETVRATDHLPGNRCFEGDYRGLLEGGEGRAAPRFRFPIDIDLVYLDPPYTADHYSRFYHVLDVLARYDYPPLERDRSGRVVRGRYPAIETRFLSGFSSRARVEEEFRTVARAAAGSGAKLVVSYSSPTGLLLREYARRGERDPLRRFEDLFRESFRDVSAQTLPMLHSGQGDSFLSIDEVLVVCRDPRGRGTPSVGPVT